MAFRGVAAKEIRILIEDAKASGLQLLEGERALGYLRYRGARTDDVSELAIFANHPGFPIVEKILQKISESALRQRRGLEQRGVANQNVAFAKKFVDHLESQGFLITPKNRKDLIQVTEPGRDMLALFFQGKQLPKQLVPFLEKN